MPRTVSLFTGGLLANTEEKKEMGLNNKQYVCSIGAASAVDQPPSRIFIGLLERYAASKARYNRDFKNKVMVLSRPYDSEWGYHCHNDEMQPSLYNYLKSFDNGSGIYLYCLRSEVSSLTSSPQNNSFYELNSGYGSITEISRGSNYVENAISHKVK